MTMTDREWLYSVPTTGQIADVWRALGYPPDQRERVLYKVDHDQVLTEEEEIRFGQLVRVLRLLLR